MAGHRAELADLGVDHREEGFDIRAEDFAVLIENVVRARAEADGRRDVPLVVPQRELAIRTDDEGGVEPAVRELRHFLDDTAAGDPDLVLAGLVRQRLEFRAVEGDGLLHEAVDAVFTLARRRHALHEVLRKHDQSGRQLPVVADAEVDHLQGAVHIALDVGTIFGHVHVRLHDEGGVLLDLLRSHRSLQRR